MPNYYNKNTLEVKEIPQELYDEWVLLNNPKANDYELVVHLVEEHSVFDDTPEEVIP